MWIGVSLSDVLAILLLCFLEGVLSMDNALVLAVSVKHLSPEKQTKALTYGICGAFIFRFIALFFLSDLIHLTWVKAVGAAYLIYLGVSHFIFKGAIAEGEKKLANSGFWFTVLSVEMIDLVFSVDSITAAVAVSQRVAIIFIGGCLGIIMMRFAANMFSKIIEKHPKLESVAYGLVTLIGIKLGVQACLG